MCMGIEFCPSLSKWFNQLFFQHCESLEKSSYCCAGSQPARHDWCSSESTVWYSEMPLYCSSPALPPHLDCLSIRGNLDPEASGTSSALSSQKWEFSPPAAGTQRDINETKPWKQTSDPSWPEWHKLLWTEGTNHKYWVQVCLIISGNLWVLLVVSVEESGRISSQYVCQ